MKIDSICGDFIDYRGRIGEQCVVLRDGRIIEFTEKPRGVAIDLRGRNLKIIPGIIDIHVHLRGLEQSYKEDEETGTLQALVNGITTVIDMPNTKPPLKDHNTLVIKLENLKKKSYVDYSVYAGIPVDDNELYKMANKPIAGFKAYPEDLEKEAMLQRAASTGKLLIIHPEDPMVNKLMEVEDLKSRNIIRPCYLEALALDYLESIEGKIHITHVSCPSTLKAAIRMGHSRDVTPHHLLYNTENVSDNCLYRVNPPLRSSSEQQEILANFLEGLFNALASDHAPHAKHEKKEPLTCRPGIQWLSLWPWLIYARLVKPGALTIEEFTYYTSKGPAEILGLEKYGVIEQEARANLIVIDPETTTRFPGIIYGKQKLPYHYMERILDYPIYVIVGGDLAYTSEKGVISKPHVSNPYEETIAGTIEY